MLDEITIESSRRRTFAIISHPDAGKTTLTEKLLLFGGAIQLAGAVKAKKNNISTRSDWMLLEQERGISVVTSVMTFEYREHILNLLDTPGHEDFSEDTYRTLTAVDSAIMIIDAAKGIEPQTLKLFEICRLRNIPIITFINKIDRESLDLFTILDEIESKLALETVPLTWPIGTGKYFVGTYDLINHAIHKNIDEENPQKVTTLEAPEVLGLLPEYEQTKWLEGAKLAQEAYPAFNHPMFQAGHQTPIFFGSALRNFGVKNLLNALVDFAPSPQKRETDRRMVHPQETKMTGFIFRMQANMDPNHRDRIAFLRICSGKLERGMKVKLVRSGKSITLSAPQFFFARNRMTTDQAFAGDIVGIPNHRNLQIRDTLTEGEDILFQGIPDFAPEILQRIRTKDGIKAQKMKEAITQMAEEGVVQIFFPEDGSPSIIGVVGALQLDVLKERLKSEYNLETQFETTRFSICRWIFSNKPEKLNHFIETHRSSIARDVDSQPIFLAENTFSLNYEAERWKEIIFQKFKDHETIKNI